MKVYIITRHINYEDTDNLTVYSDSDKAEKELNRLHDSNDSRGLVFYNIEEHEVIE